jgi:hypothetical protein
VPRVEDEDLEAQRRAGDQEVGQRNGARNLHRARSCGSTGFDRLGWDADLRDGVRTRFWNDCFVFVENI